MSGIDYCLKCGCDLERGGNLCPPCQYEASGYCPACNDPVELCWCDLDDGPNDRFDRAVWAR